MRTHTSFLGCTQAQWNVPLFKSLVLPPPKYSWYDPTETVAAFILCRKFCNQRGKQASYCQRIGSDLYQTLFKGLYSTNAL